MSLPPKAPDNNYPPATKPQALDTTTTFNEIKPNKAEIPIPVVLKLVLAALRVLGNRNGSTVAEIGRVLASEGHNVSVMEIRKAIIFGLKEGKVKRPLMAVKNGIYGLYVLVEEGAPPKSPKRRTKTNTKQ